jgi:excisionase family DNA binding protein
LLAPLGAFVKLKLLSTNFFHRTFFEIRMTPEIFTIEQAARYLQLDADIVLRKVKAGEIPAAKIDGKWRLRRARLDHWLDELSDFSDAAFNKLLRDTRRAAKRVGIRTPEDVDRLVLEVRRKRKNRAKS